MTNVFLIKYGELAIKGKNRYLFENRLVDTIRKNLKTVGKFDVRKEQGRITVEPVEGHVDVQMIIDRLTRIFGIIGVAYGTKENEVSIESAERLALDHMLKACEGKELTTFKVETKRADKRFPMKSMEVSAHIGGFLLDNMPGKLKVDVHNPDITIQGE